MKTFLSIQRSSLTQQDKVMLTPLETIFSDCPFTHAMASVGSAIEDIMHKVNSDIKYIEEKRYFQQLKGIIDKQESIIEINHAPDIEFSFDTNCPEAEPESVQNDRICLRECVLETRTFQHQKTHSSPYSKHSKTSSRN